MSVVTSDWITAHESPEDLGDPFATRRRKKENCRLECEGPDVLLFPGFFFCIFSNTNANNQIILNQEFVGLVLSTGVGGRQQRGTALDKLELAQFTSAGLNEI